MSACGLLPLVSRASCGPEDALGECEPECCQSAVCSGSQICDCEVFEDCCKHSGSYECTEACGTSTESVRFKKCAEYSQMELCKDHTEKSELFKMSMDCPKQCEQAKFSENCAYSFKEIKDSEDCVEPSDQIEEETSEEIEDSEEYAEPTDKFEDFEDCVEPFAQINNIADCAEPSELIRDFKDYEKPSEQIEISEDCANPSKQFNNMEDYTEPFELTELLERSAEPFKQIEDYEDSSEPSEQSEDFEDYAEPTENFEEFEDYVELSAKIKLSEVCTELSEQIQDSEDCSEPFKQAEISEGFAKSCEQISDSEDCAECYEQIDLSEYCIEPYEDAELSEDCAEHCYYFEDSALQQSEPLAEITEHCEWHRGCTFFEQNNLTEDSDEDSKRCQLCGNNRSEQSRFSESSNEHCEGSGFLLEPNGPPEMCQTLEKNYTAEYCVKTPRDGSLEPFQTPVPNMYFKKSEPCETFEETTPNECALKDCKVCTYFRTSLQNLLSKHCTKKVEALVQMIEPQHCDSSKNYNENKLSKSGKMFFEGEDCTSLQTEYYENSEILNADRQSNPHEQGTELTDSLKCNGTSKQNRPCESNAKDHKDWKYFEISRQSIFTEHCETSDCFSRNNELSEWYSQPGNTSDGSATFCQCSKPLHRSEEHCETLCHHTELSPQAFEQLENSKHSKASQPCENVDIKSEKSPGQSETSQTSKHIEHIPGCHISDHCLLLEQKKPNECILQHRINHEQHLLKQTNLSKTSDHVEQSHTAQQSGPTQQNYPLEQKQTLEHRSSSGQDSTADQPCVPEVREISDQCCNQIIEVVAFHSGKCEQADPFDFFTEHSELCNESNELSEHGSYLSENSQTSEQHSYLEPSEYTELPGNTVLPKQCGSSESHSECCEWSESSNCSEDSLDPPKSAEDRGHLEACTDHCDRCESTKTSEQGEPVDLYAEHCKTSEHSVTPEYRIRQCEMLEHSKPLGECESFQNAENGALWEHSSPCEEPSEQEFSQGCIICENGQMDEHCRASQQTELFLQSVSCEECSQLCETSAYSGSPKQCECCGNFAVHHNNFVFGQISEQRDKHEVSNGHCKPCEPSAVSHNEQCAEYSKLTPECGHSEQSKMHIYCTEHFEYLEEDKVPEHCEDNKELHKQSKPPKHCAEHNESPEHYEDDEQGKLPEHSAEHKMTLGECETCEKIKNSEHSSEQSTFMQLCAEQHESCEQTKFELCSEHSEPSEHSETFEQSLVFCSGDSKPQPSGISEQTKLFEYCTEISGPSEDSKASEQTTLVEDCAEDDEPSEYSKICEKSQLELCSGNGELSLYNETSEQSLDCYIGGNKPAHHRESSEQPKFLEHCAEDGEPFEHSETCEQSKLVELSSESCKASAYSETSEQSKSLKNYAGDKPSQPSETSEQPNLVHCAEDGELSEYSETFEQTKLKHSFEDNKPCHNEISEQRKELALHAEECVPSEHSEALKQKLEPCGDEYDPPEQSECLSLVYQSRDPEDDDDISYESEDFETCDCDFCVVSIEQVPVKPLLHQIKSEDVGKICVVLDLDETLVHSSFKPMNNADFVVPVEIEGTVHQVYVLKRPHVDEFLKRMGEMFECVLFTASLAKYADPVSDELDKWGAFRSRLFRESCVFHRGNYVKDLGRLGRDLNKIIIVDNSPASYIFHPNNAVPVASWFNDMSDTQLLDLIPFFERLSTAEDIYAILKDQTL